ncbi:MAG: LacI family DNA-binding transcriptional regulator [Anaerolineae bacterium]|nr:LacI family DNA-binding transcriptional regulator [Anaerolineae bacterium]
MRPTIYTVAEKAGVSIATVSRVLNGTARVNEETCAKVHRVMDALGYQPNASARGLAANTTSTIAVVFPKLSGPFFSELIQGAEIAARDNEYHLLIYGASGERLGADNQTLGMLTTKVDGLILASSGISRCYLRDLQRQNLPVVVLGEDPSDIPADSIQPDNIGGAEKIVNHLIGHGYRRIAMIKGPATRTHANDREQGYRKALHDHNLSCYPELVIDGSFDESSGYAGMQQLLKLDPMPDAVFTASDQMAIGAMAAIHESGLRVPGDIALVGFDDIETARYMNPPLTTVHQDMLGQGELAVHMLLARIKGMETDIETKILPTTLVIRRSCGCAAPV